MKITKKAAAAAACVFCSLMFPFSSLAGNWRFDETGWKFYDSASAFKRSQWFQDEDGCWYYLDESGNMMTDTVTPDGYTVGEDGAWIVKIPQRYVHIAPDETCNHKTSGKSEPVFQVETDKPLVALTFDSGSNLSHTEQLLEILDKHQVRSTFFLTKEWMDTHEEEVLKIHKKGHEIGNHSVDHPDFTALTTAQMTAQIQDTHKKIKELTGRDAFLFRVPLGAYDTAVIDTIKENGYYCIQWTVDSLDWKNLGLQPLLDRVLKHKDLTNGSIVLMHNGADYTPAALDTIITEILARGYEIVPVSELIYTRNYTVDAMGIQHPVK